MKKNIKNRKQVNRYTKKTPNYPYTTKKKHRELSLDEKYDNMRNIARHTHISAMSKFAETPFDMRILRMQNKKNIAEIDLAYLVANGEGNSLMAEQKRKKIRSIKNKIENIQDDLQNAFLHVINDKDTLQKMQNKSKKVSFWSRGLNIEENFFK